MQRSRVSRTPVLRARGYIVNAFTSACSRHSSRRESAMRFTLFPTLVAFALVACGGDKKSAASQAEAATPTPAAVPAGVVVEVKMTGNGTSVAAFEPSKLTVKTGTTVRFINVSGGPHDVAFFADSIPKGAADALKKGMPNPMGDLTGPFLTQPNE